MHTRERKNNSKVKGQRSTVKDNKGFSIVEIVVACSIMLFSMFAVMALAQKSVQLSRFSLQQTEASFLLEEGAEAMRLIRDNNWTTISNLTAGTNYYLTFSGGTWNLGTNVVTDGVFTRKVVIATVNRNSSDDIATSGTLDANTKKATVSVSWLLPNGTTSTKSVSLYLANIFN